MSYHVTIMRFGNSAVIGISTIILVAFSAGIAAAWTGPTATAPGNNVSAPINLSSAAQVKNGTIGVNGLAVFGNTLLQGSSYLNFGSTAGSAGYGIWDNAGTLNFKNSGGSWQSLQSLVAGLVGSGTIGGSGTAGYIPRLTGATTLGNSSLMSDGNSTTANGNLFTTGAISVNGNIGLYGKSPTSGYPSGWGGGVHTWDLYAEGTVGVGPSGGPAAVYLNSSGNIYANGSLTVNGGATVGGSTVCTAANGACGSSSPSWASITGKPYPVNGQTWNWSGQGGQPTWLWGSNDGTNMYVWNPSNFSVYYANSSNYANSAGNANTTDGYSLNQAVTNGASPTFGTLYSNYELVVQNALNISGNQMWTNNGTLYLNYSNTSGGVQVGNGSSGNLYVSGDIYDTSRGSWVSQIGRGATFVQYGSTASCPSGSFMIGWGGGQCAQYLSYGGGCSVYATYYATCQYMN